MGGDVMSMPQQNNVASTQISPALQYYPHTAPAVTTLIKALVAGSSPTSSPSAPVKGSGSRLMYF
jgi:hypothetical protein